MYNVFRVIAIITGDSSGAYCRRRNNDVGSGGSWHWKNSQMCNK